MRDREPAVRIEVLGQFRVGVGERTVALGDWPSRRSRELVELLALADGGRLPRERVVDDLWPELDAEAGAANLRKAAHLARRALGEPAAIALRGGRVELFPGRRVTIDLARFIELAAAAATDPDPALSEEAAAACPGELLPDSLYEPWTLEPRRRVRELLCDVLRRAARWERLADLEPADEAACRALMTAALDAGRRHLAIRHYERCRLALARDFGMRPGPETQALYERCTSSGGSRGELFVGRDLELAQMAELLASVAAGRPAAALVRGPSGSGKTAFCREAGVRAQAGRWRVLRAAGSAPGRPYGPLGEIVEQLLLLDRAAIDALPLRTRSILARLSPLAPPAPEHRGPLTRHQVGAALQRALADTSAGVPTLLVVDDAHLLDEATAQALSQLAAGGGEPLLVMLAYRSEWVRTSLPAGLAELAASDRSVTIRLGPLSGAEVAELVRTAAPEPPSAAVVARVVELAEGQPFFALELARANVRDGSEGLPPTVRQAVLRRLEGVDQETTSALEALALAGDDLDLGGVLALTGLDEAAAFGVLDAALDSGILVVSGARYRFQHELVRLALADEVPPHRRARLHRDAAARLAGAGAAPELIAEHWLRGERPAEAREWLLRAARRAFELGALADALGHVDRLLATAPEHSPALLLRAEILDALGDGRAPEAYALAAMAVGEPEATELRARQALAQLKASNPEGALHTLAGLRPRSLAGRLAEALTLSAAAAVGIYGDSDTARAKASEAHQLAVELGDPGAVLDATWAYALAAHARGELLGRLREFMRATHELPDIAIRVFDGQLCVTERMLYGGLPYAEIKAFADGLAREAGRIGAARGEAFAVTLRGEAELLSGQLAAADRDFAEGARLHGRIGAVAGEALSLLGRGQVAIRRGRPEHAAPHLAGALLMARESEVGHHTLDRVYGAMVEAAGDGAVEIVREAESAIRGPAETCPTCRIAFIVPATIAAARAHDSERAERYLEDCERALQIVALPPAWHAAVEEARAWVARAAGAEKEARERFRHAAEGFRAWGQPVDARRCAASAGGRGPA